MLVVYLSIVRGILKEKESKAREGMRMMGMSDSSFYLSWIIYYLLVTFVISLICNLILKASIFKHSDYFLMFLVHWIYGISLIFQGIFVTSFFTNSKMGVVFGIVLFISLYGLEQAWKSISLTTVTKALTAILPQTAMSYCANTFIAPEIMGQGILWQDIAVSIDKFSILTGIVMMALNIIIFAFLSIYLDQVIPGEFGK